MKNLFIVILILTIGNSKSFGQSVDREKETKETIEWLNSKLAHYNYKSSDIKQIFLINEIRKIDGEYFIIGIKEQRSDNPLAAFRVKYRIPIEKVNNISFTEKAHNYWIDISMKNNEKVIKNTSFSGEDYENTDSIDIILSKSIDNENLQPRILKAFNYLLSIYGNVKTEKF